MKFTAIRLLSPKDWQVELCDATSFPLDEDLYSILQGSDRIRPAAIPVPSLPGWTVHGSTDGRCSFGITLESPRGPYLGSYALYGTDKLLRQSEGRRLGRGMRRIGCVYADLFMRLRHKPQRWPVAYLWRAGSYQLEAGALPKVADTLVLPLLAAQIEVLYREGVAA